MRMSRQMAPWVEGDAFAKIESARCAPATATPDDDRQIGRKRWGLPHTREENNQHTRRLDGLKLGLEPKTHGTACWRNELMAHQHELRMGETHHTDVMNFILGGAKG